MKKLIQIVLGVVMVGLAYIVVMLILDPLEFQKQKTIREEAVIDRIKDIRVAQRAFKQANQRYTSSFDTLVNFVLKDSMVFERAIGSADDSIAVAKGLVGSEKFKVAVIDTIFGVKKLTPEQVNNFELIPYTDGSKFIMGAGNFLTESKVMVAVFECKAPYKAFLSDIDDQELINLIDDRKSMNKYPGIKVGSLTEATNDAGNWE